jgi:hypothetical protein
MEGRMGGWVDGRTDRRKQGSKEVKEAWTEGRKEVKEGRADRRKEG